MAFRNPLLGLVFLVFLHAQLLMLNGALHNLQWTVFGDQKDVQYNGSPLVDVVIIGLLIQPSCSLFNC